MKAKGGFFLKSIKNKNKMVRKSEGKKHKGKRWNQPKKRKIGENVEMKLIRERTIVC
jgi:hypothetical protein